MGFAVTRVIVAVAFSATLGAIHVSVTTIMAAAMAFAATRAIALAAFSATLGAIHASVTIITITIVILIVKKKTIFCY